MTNESLTIEPETAVDQPLKSDALTTAIMLGTGVGMQSVNSKKLKDILNPQAIPETPETEETIRTRRSIRNLIKRNPGLKSIRNKSDLD